MPWVPRDLYDELIQILRASRAGVVSLPPATVTPVPVVEPAPAVALAESAPLMLSPAVYEACVRFAFGDPNEKSMNLAQAKRLMRDGHRDAAIIAHVRAGGQPVTV
jgi:hypothetical protein